MKRKFSIVMLAVGMLAIFSCGTRNGKGLETGDSVREDVLVYDSLEWRDSVVLESGASARVELFCIFPKENGTALADSMRLWILEQFVRSGESDDSQNNLSTACEPTEDVAGRIRQTGQQLLKTDAAEVRELDKERGEGYPISYERDGKIAIAFDNEQFTTLSLNYYVYLAGAHGSTLVNYATFRKSDGHRMDWDLLEGMTRKEIAEAIKQGLCEYFEVGMDELPDQLLFNTIDEEESRRIFNEEFPLPSIPPFLTAEGVNIVYQQYEIACYAAGMPTCIIKRKAE